MTISNRQICGVGICGRAFHGRFPPHYDHKTRRIVLHLSSKLIVSFSPDDVEGLNGALPRLADSPHPHEPPPLPAMWESDPHPAAIVSALARPRSPPCGQLMMSSGVNPFAALSAALPAGHTLRVPPPYPAPLRRPLAPQITCRNYASAAYPTRFAFRPIPSAASSISLSAPPNPKVQPSKQNKTH